MANSQPKYTIQGREFNGWSGRLSGPLGVVLEGQNKKWKASVRKQGGVQIVLDGCHFFLLHCAIRIMRQSSGLVCPDVADLLDLLPFPMFLLATEGDGRLAAANQLGLAFCKTSDCLSHNAAQGLLRANSPAVNQSLQSTLRKSASQLPAILQLEREPTKPPVLAIVGKPARRGGWIPLAIHNPEQGIRKESIVLFQSHYRITESESKLLNLLLQGESLRDAAVRLKISPNTAKSQLAAIFDKTQCRSQQALLRLFLQGCYAMLTTLEAAST